MSKHVSSGDDNAAASQRDAVTESLTTRETADDAENRLPQGAPGGRNGDGTKDAVGAAAKVYAGVAEPLSADDVAACIVWTLELPVHVNIDSMVVRPRAQASNTLVARDQ